jgi:hypothetical protein
VELLDPEDRSDNVFEEMVREVIGFYATVLDEVVGKPAGAASLLAASKSPDLFRTDAPSPIDVLSRGQFPLAFHSSTIRLVADTKSRTFMGSFWETRAVEAFALVVPDWLSKYPYQYVGIDSEIWAAIEGRSFESLLSLHKGTERLIEIESEDAVGIFYMDRYGVLRAWLNRIPDAIDFRVSGQL